MANLVGLDLPLGEALADAIAQCRVRGDAFCVLDPRDSPSRRRAVLEALRPTALFGDDGVVRPRNDGLAVEDGDGAVIVTSGSSGPLKAVVHTWESLEASAALTSAALRRTGDDRWWACLPASHVGGLAVLLRGVLHDRPTVFATTAREARALGATHVAVVRTQLTRDDFRDFACVLVGGSTPPRERAANVVTTWGMTETGSGVVYDGTSLPSVLVASLNGELIVKSPTLFRAYRHAPRPATTGPDGASDWFPTGDAGVVRDGRVEVHGRLAYVINTGGEKVWPEDLEGALQPTNGVEDLAVVGVPDEEWGHRVVVLAVSDRDASSLLDEWRGRAREAIGPWAQPKEVRLVAAIPRTDNGKVRRDQLLL